MVNLSTAIPIAFFTVIVIIIIVATVFAVISFRKKPAETIFQYMLPRYGNPYMPDSCQCSPHCPRDMWVGATW